MKISSPRLYDFLKFLAMIVLPAFATLYFTLAGIWDLPKAQEVVNTIIAVDTFLGVVLQISTAKYDSKRVGDIEVQELESGSKTYSLNLEGQPEEIEKVDEARFKVVKKEKKKPLPSRHRTGKRRQP
jgi:hypothetical protein